MPLWLEAGLWGLLAGGALVLGAAIGYTVRLPKSMHEYLRIEAREDGIVYVASPMGTGTTDFRLTEVSDSRAVFENLEHDFPQKIIYTVTGSRLEAEVGAVQDGEWRSRTLRLTRIECGSTAVRDSDHDESP